MYKNIKIIIILLLLITSPALLYSQKGKPCGRQEIDLQAQEKAESFTRQQNRTDAVTRMIRVYFHICRDNDGSNAGATEAQIQTEFARLQADYAANDLCFANMGIDYIDNTNVNNMINPNNVAASTAALSPFMVAGCLNIFYQAALANGDGGNAYSIPNTFCSVTRGNIGFQGTISHEVGHCLGLSHTHETVNGPGAINGSNCGTTGDRVCDTPADPYSFRNMPCFSNNNCSYTGNCQDPNNATNYSPPYNNIMSYWEQLGCNRTAFTAGQYTRLNGFLSTNAGLLATQSAASALYGPQTITSGWIMLSAIFDFTTTGDVVFGGNAEIAVSARKITLTPGFRATSLSGALITIKPTTCSY